MQRFEIMEKSYSFKALLKMAGGGGDASPTSPIDPPLLFTQEFKYLAVMLTCRADFFFAKRKL